MTNTSSSRGRQSNPLAREERRQQILAAALDCFAAKGFHAATTAEISAAAGISVAGLYQYFPSKEDLVAAIVAGDLGENIRRVRHLRDSPDFMSGIDDILHEMTRTTAIGHHSLRLEILSEAARSPRIAELLAEADAKLIDEQTQAVRNAQQRGQVDPQLDPRYVAIALNSLSDGALARLCLPPEARGPFVLACMDMVRRALNVPQAR